MGKSKDFESEEYIKESIKRFYEHIYLKENGCWIWCGCTNQKYGVFRFKGRNKSIHRFCYEYIKKENIDDKFVCHSCDQPLCVNPEHLFLGTHKDNMKDARQKKRHAFGEKHYLNKLKETEVKELRLLVKSGMSGSFIGEILGIDPISVSQIATGKNWKHTPNVKYDSDNLINCMKIVLGELSVYKVLKFYEKYMESFQ